MEEKKKLFNITIRNIDHPVYDIKDKKNDINGDTRWIEFNSYPLYGIFDYIPYMDNECNKINWNISIKQGNSIKTINNEKIVSGFTIVYLKIKDKEIYSFYADNIDHGFNMVRNIMYKLEKLPIDLNELEKLKDKKIYYKGLPAIIEKYSSEGNIIIKSDCSKREYDKWWDDLIQPWFTEDDIKNCDECKYVNKIKVNIIDDNIHWFRNDRVSKILKIKRTLK